MQAEVFKALGDPLRLEMVKRLSNGMPHTMGNLTRDLGISRQGARKQVQVLESAHVVHLEPRGRQVNVSLDIKTLQRSKAFIAHLESEWGTRLRKLKDVVEKHS